MSHDLGTRAVAGIIFIRQLTQLVELNVSEPPLEFFQVSFYSILKKSSNYGRCHKKTDRISFYKKIHVPFVKSSWLCEANTKSLWNCPFLSSFIATFSRLKRRSRPELFCKKGVLKNFAKCTGKHICHKLCFLMKLHARPVTLF